MSDSAYPADELPVEEAFDQPGFRVVTADGETVDLYTVDRDIREEVALRGSVYESQYYTFEEVNPEGDMRFFRGYLRRKTGIFDSPNASISLSEWWLAEEGVESRSVDVETVESVDHDEEDKAADDEVVT